MDPHQSTVAHASTPLITGWTFKQGDRSSTDPYVAANDLPTEIHRDLLKHGRIADLFIDFNEHYVRWVADETWTYRTNLLTPQDYSRLGVSAVLKLEGLDTFATVYLNGHLILTSDNMFHTHHVDVRSTLHPTSNVLEIVFASARKKGLELVVQYSEHRFIVHQTEISRGPVRRAQYDWGWDWGPVLLTAGPWKPIFIETFACRLEDLWVRYELQDNLKTASVRVKVRIWGVADTVGFTIMNNATGDMITDASARVEVGVEAGTAEVSFVLDEIELWWPRGYGAQTLCTLHAYVQDHSSHERPLHTVSQRFGFRKTELVQEPDTRGTSFYFRINNVDIFCGGSCWIPADSFLTRLMPDKYRDWVELAASGNQIMLRVWGGGIYEADAFFEAADELGVLVWQDFAFACANYPAYPEYLASVEKEARQNVRRLRNHPSLVIWAGNNEDYQIVERYKLNYNVDDKDPESWLKTDFPARYIYEHLLPQILTEESPNTPYHPSSPFGNGTSTVLQVDPTIGDVHQWNMWHGTMESYQRLPHMGGRFVSEFGMEAYPHVSTLEQCISHAADRHPSSMAMDARNKAIGHERRLLSYVAENFRVQYDLEGFTHLSQVMQADAMTWAYRSWRRQWGLQGSRKCGGALVWQLNDCWPTISWAVVDYHLVPKPAYYAIKRAMQPVAIGVQRGSRVGP